MADITMCKGENCPMKETCYRYKAVPSEYWQSYFTKLPLEIIEGKVECKFYWEINTKKNESNHL